MNLVVAKCFNEKITKLFTLYKFIVFLDTISYLLELASLDIKIYQI